MRSVNPAGIAFLKEQEGLRLKAYRCSAGKLTIGWGHTGPDVKEGMRIPLELAQRLFLVDLMKHGRALDGYVTALVGANQWSALVSLAFNMGADKIGRSTLVQLLNARNVAGATDEFLKWKYVNIAPPGEPKQMVVDEALLARRHREQALFLAP